MIKGTIMEAEREVSLCPLTGEILDWHSFGYNESTYDFAGRFL